MTTFSTVLILGCGYLGEAVARLARARGLRVVATVRDEARASRLRHAGLEVIAAPALSEDALAPFANAATHVVIAFPPDGATDARVAPCLASAGALAYTSSTGVYADVGGEVNDATPVPAAKTDRVARILAAEASWRAVGATVLRSPAIYGTDRGIHRRIIRGEHRIAGDGTAYTSRIHVEDLAQLALAAGKTRGETFVVGDLAPATQNEIAEWVCREYQVAMPPHVPREDVPESLRADRRIDGSRALRVLDVTLAYPSYVTGMAKSPESR